MTVSWQAVLFAFWVEPEFFFLSAHYVDGLQSVAETACAVYWKGTRNPVRGVFTGLIVTGLIQSRCYHRTDGRTEC